MGNELVTDQDFIKQDYTTTSLPVAEYEGCTFTNCNFSNATLSRVQFIDCNFINCNMMMAKVEGTAFKTVNFLDCKLLGVRFDTADPFLISFSFKNCILNLANFFKMKLKKTRFDSCSMHEADFTQTELIQVIFHNCDLLNSVFDQSNLSKADLRSAINFNIDPLKNNIKKAMFSVDGLPGLLRGFDIDINY